MMTDVEPADGAQLGALTTEGRRAGSADLDRRSSVDLVLGMNDEDAGVPAAVRAAAAAIAATADAVAERVRGGGRIIYVGAGTAGRVGQQDAAELPPTFGLDRDRSIGLLAGGAAAATVAQENVEDDEDAGTAAIDELGVDAADAVIGIAASGRTPYTIAATRRARELGAFTAAVVCNEGSALAAAAEIAIEVVVGPEFITGSTRLKAGTAQKLVLNTISTVAMVRSGKTYGDLMIDVRPSNAKLRVRARRIVAQATGCDDDTSATALNAADGDIRTAVVLLLTGLPVADAARVAAAYPSLRDAVEAAGAGTAHGVQPSS
jgi:N-acetylmuramic acid 6-phosphate etherase